jgi:MFS transporter, ACS family, hexuronate transporter
MQESAFLEAQTPEANRAGGGMFRQGFAKLPLRWLAIGVFVLSNVLNFLDRQLLAAVAPTLKQTFHLSNTQYGTLVSAFSLAYAVMTPLAGLLVDRLGLNVAVITAIVMWSAASISTGLATTFGGLLVSRASLGLGEAGALPMLSKANASYMQPSEWGLANAAGSVTLTLGTIAAPLLVAWIAPSYGWRAVFVISGSLGLLWLVLWWFTARRIPTRPAAAVAGPRVPIRKLLRDRRMLGVAVAYALVMTVFILWLNWTTVYLVQQHHLTQTAANRQFAWIPPIFGTLGGLFSGWLGFRWIRRGVDALKARMRICILCAPLFMITAIIPYLHSASLAIAAVALSLFACQSVIGSLNVIPLDLFGPGRAAFSISLLGCAYSLMQTFVSPLIGASVDHFGFSAVCTAVAVLPLLGIYILRGTFK